MKFRLIYIFVLCVFYKVCTAQIYFNNRYDLFTKADATANVFCKDSCYFVSCGGLDVTQSNLSLSLIKLNKFGIIIASKHYFKTNNWFYTGLANSTCQLNDSVLISTGYRVGSGTSKSFIHWYKNNLDSIKYLEYGFVNKENVIYSILNDNLKYLYQIGYVDSSYTNSDILLIKTDTSGNEIWKKKIGVVGWDEYGWGIKMSSDGKLLISGNKRAHNGTTNGAYILKADTNGAVMWQQYFWSNQGLAATALIELPNTDIVAIAGKGYGGNTRMELIKLDSAGNLIFDKEYGSFTDRAEPYAMIMNDKGNLVAAGQNYYPSLGGKVNGLMYEFNQNGDSLFSREYAIQPGSQNYFRDVVQAPDKGYAFSGFISPLFANGGTGTQDIWLLKTDSTFCESAVSCGYPTNVSAPFSEREGLSLRLFPNPAKDILYIDLGEAYKNTKIEIYNAVGSLVLTEYLTTQYSSLNTHHLISGIYFYKAVCGDKVVQNKLVIIK